MPISQTQRAVLIVLALLLAMAGNSWAQSQPEPQPQSKTSPLSEQHPTAQPAPAANSLTSQQIAQSIANGIEAAAKQYDTRHPATPPDNSGWYFNLFLVAFTGGLFVVGGAQCFLIFWTLKATQVAAKAAQTAAEAVPAIERAYVLLAYLTARLPPAPPWPPDGIPRYAQVNVIFRNYGRTPANISFAMIIARVLDHIPEEADIPQRMIDSNAALRSGDIAESIYAVLGTSNEDREWNPGDFRSEEQITPQVLAQLNAGTALHLYCWGKIVYRDLFGNENPTDFCFRYNVRRKVFEPVGGMSRNSSK